METEKGKEKEGPLAYDTILGALFISGMETEKGKEKEGPLAYDTILGLLNSKIQSVSRKRIQIRQAEEYCSLRNPVNQDHKQLLQSKPSVEFIFGEFLDLRYKLSKLLNKHMKPISTQKPPAGSKPRILSTAPAPIEEGSSPLSMQNRSPLTEEEEKGLRYLCVSDGFVIHCLDLKLSKDEYEESDLEPLPIVSTLNLLGMGLPVSMGLFELEENTYMVGGQVFPDLNNLPHTADSLYKVHGLEGTSCKIYSLSLDGRSLSLTESNKFPLLKKPKFWPIVEKIGDQLHVIESLPMGILVAPPTTLPSHEFINLNCIDDGWTTVRQPLRYHKDEGEEGGLYICQHLLVHECIYARVLWDCEAALSFDFLNWNYHAPTHFSDDAFNIANLFGGGPGRCVRAFSLGDFNRPVNVAIGIMNRGHVPCKEMVAVARIVSPRRWRHCCTQVLPCLFGPLKKPYFMSQGSVFSVEEKSRRMCAVVLGREVDTERRFLFVSIFRVVFIADAFQMLRSWGPGGKDGDYEEGILSEDEEREDAKEFVKVIVEESHVYELGFNLWPAALVPPRLSACFLLDQ